MSSSQQTTPSSSGRPTARKGSSSATADVRVVVRIRPPNEMELKGAGHTTTVVCKSNTDIEIEDDSVSDRKFAFDQVYGEKSAQEEVFAYVAKPIVQDVMSGYNGTIFAYGQTGSGKTHTMEGQISDADGAGVIPRAVGEIFRAVEAADDNILFTIKVSYVEVYMERIRDLLDENGVKTNLQVREDKVRGVYISGATEEYVTSEAELLATLSSGARNRAVAATGMNSGSSRSHSVFIVSVQQTEVSSQGTKTGTLFLVDLAGSEMVKKTHASGQVLEEAKTINKSLSALGQVINALTDGKSAHVPYRDSRLTRILQNSLGGNSKTCLIVCCSPCAYNQPETISSLRFGSRAKRIKNRAVVNEERSSVELAALLAKAEATIELQAAHIAALEAQLQEAAARRGSSDVLTASTPTPLPYSGTQPLPPPPLPARGGTAGAAAAAAGAAALGSSVDDNDAVATAARKEEKVTGPAAGSADGAAPAAREAIGSSGGGGAEEAAAAIVQLTQRLTALEAELEEEREEGARRTREADALAALLGQRDAAAAADHRADERRAEEAAAAAAAATAAEAARALAQAREGEERARYDAREASLTVDRLLAENARLTEEIRELTHDAVARTEVRRSSVETAAAAPAPLAAAGTSLQMPTAGAIAAAAPQLPAELPAAAIEYLQAREAAWAGERAVLAAAAAQGGKEAVAARRDAERRVSDTEEQREKLVADVQRSQERAVALQEALDGRGDAAVTAVTAAAAAAASAAAAAASAAAVDGRGNNGAVAREEADAAAAAARDAAAAAEAVAVTERAKELRQKQELQNKLEALVVVHRQLLRKLGSLELANRDLEKKVALRDERIRQLEGNMTQLAASMRQQSERHGTELAKIRSEVLLLHEEHERQQAEARHYQRLSAAAGERYGAAAAATSGYQQPRAIRGGGASHQVHQVKTVRGGGGGGGSSSYAVRGGSGGSGSAAAARELPADFTATSVGQRGSILGRLFGIK